LNKGATIVSCIMKLIQAHQNLIPRDFHRTRMSATQYGLSQFKHRDAYGIHWRTGKTGCCVPAEVAVHKSTSNREDRRIDRKQFLLYLSRNRLACSSWSTLAKRIHVHLFKFSVNFNLPFSFFCKSVYSTN